MYKALIVDDEPIIMEGLKHVIQWESFGVEIAATVSDAYEALSFLQKQPVDIVITDIRMPEMDGLQLVQEIRDRKLGTKIIILSGYGDFAYVKKAAVLGIENYLLKPIDEQELSMTIQHTVEKLANDRKMEFWQRKNDRILRENILFRWLTGNITESELKDRAGFLGINLSRAVYLVCIIHILRPKCAGESQLSHLSFAVQNISAELLENCHNSIVFNGISGDTVVIFSDDDAGFQRDDLDGRLKKVVGSLRSSLDIHTVVTVGSKEKGYLSATVSYKLAYQLQNYRILHPADTVIWYDEIRRACRRADSAVKIDYRELKSAMYQKDTAAVQRFLDDIYDEISKAGDLSPESVKCLVIEILYHIFSTLDVRGIANDFEGKDGDGLLDVLNRDTLPELFKWLKELTAAYICEMQSSGKKLSPVIGSVLNYVKRHYGEDLSLKTLSENYHINAAYLGQLFKRETGELFSAYLNRYRMEKAKEMLRATPWKESEIASRVGYTNVNYFSNLFKKVVGIYPSDYRVADAER